MTKGIKIVLAAIVLVHILFVFSFTVLAETSCERLERLKKEWITLEEKTSGGVFYSNPGEVMRLRALRKIMKQPASICGGNENVNVDLRYEQVQSVYED